MNISLLISGKFHYENARHKTINKTSMRMCYIDLYIRNIYLRVKYIKIRLLYTINLRVCFFLLRQCDRQ